MSVGSGSSHIATLRQKLLLFWKIFGLNFGMKFNRLLVSKCFVKYEKKCDLTKNLIPVTCPKIVLFVLNHNEYDPNYDLA